MKLTRDAWLAIGLFATLAALTVFAAIQQTQQQRLPPLADDSTAPDGARALWLWLDELGYQPDSDIQAFYEIPEQTKLVLILEPTELIADDEWRTIDDWVNDGGTLILAGERFAFGVAASHYDFTLVYLDADSNALAPQTPLLASPPLTAAAPVQARAFFQTTRTDFVAHLGVPPGPVVVSFDAGPGRVILCAAPYLFSNAGLKETGNPALALNLISAARQRGAAWFDEWHHGLRSTNAKLAGPTDWLVAAPAGRALLLVAVVIFFALLVRGRRFGRPVPLAKSIARRAPLEYITAIANLSRRAAHRQAVLRQYHQHLKRTLGHRYRLSPTLPDAQYARQLAEYNPAIDEKALLDLLAKLTRPRLSENDMIQFAAQVADWTKD